MRSLVGGLLSALTVLTLLVMTSGCAATQTSIAKRHIDVQTTASDSIFLTPVVKSTLYVQVRNTTDKAELDMEPALRAALAAKGVQLVTDPDVAHFHL